MELVVREYIVHVTTTKIASTNLTITYLISLFIMNVKFLLSVLLLNQQIHQPINGILLGRIAAATPLVAQGERVDPEHAKAIYASVTICRKKNVI